MFKKILKALMPAGNPIFEPRMPEVDGGANVADVFAKARSPGAGSETGANASTRHVVIVTPGRLLMLQPCPAQGSMAAEQVAAIRSVIPETPKRNIAAIAYNDLAALRADPTKAIPFLGMLLGFAYIGHNVWVFEGHASALLEGGRDADVLIVDGGMVPFLRKDWQSDVRVAMRRPEIYLHDRRTFRLSPLREGAVHGQ